MNDSKYCPKCACFRALTDFNKNKSSRDHLQSRCRSCQLIQNQEWRERNPDSSRALARRRNRYYRSIGKRKRDSLQQRRAHDLVYKAIIRGELIRPSECPRCGGTNSPIHAHHDDYSKPLDVQWLCARCHQRSHAIGEAS